MKGMFAGLATLFLLLAPSSSWAITSTWTGVDSGSWSDAGNWSSAGVPGSTSGTVNTDSAIFSGSAPNETIVIDQGYNIKNLQFSSTAVAFTVGSSAGNALVLTSGGALTDSMNAGSNITEAVNAPVSLAAFYTFTNSNSAASGNVLSFGGLISSINTAAETLTVSGNGGVVFDGGISSGSGTLSLSYTGSGGLTFNGGMSQYGRLTLAASSGITIISGGTTTLNAPNQEFINIGAGSELLISGGDLNLSGTNAGSGFAGSGVVVQTGGVVALSGSARISSNTYGGAVSSYTISGGTFSSSGVMRGIGNFIATGSSVVQFNSVSDTGTSPTIGSATSGTDTLTIGGNAAVSFLNAPIISSGTVTATINLNGGTFTVPGFAATSGTGVINFNGGTLQFSTSGTLNLATMKELFVQNGGAVIDTEGGSVLISDTLAASGTGGLTKVGSGTLTLSATNTYTGNTVVNAGVLGAGVATGAFGSNSAVTLANASGVTLNLANLNQTIGSLAGGGASGGIVSLGTGTLTLGANNANASYSGAITGSGAVVKTGSGTQTFNGSFAYTGTTQVTGGTLMINGSVGNGGATVASGAVLAGNVVAGGTTGIGSGGTLKVGGSGTPGAGTFSTLSLAATSTTTMQFNAGALSINSGTDFSAINVSTALIYGGNLQLVFAGTVGSQTFDLLNFSSLTPTGSFAGVLLYSNATLIGNLSLSSGVWSGTYDLGYGSGGQSFSFSQSNGDLTVAAVPEPKAWALLGIGLGCLFLRLRLHRSLRVF